MCVCVCVRVQEQVREVLQSLLQSAQGLMGDTEAETAADEPPRVHPAGISRNWSMLYVWLQVFILPLSRSFSTAPSSPLLPPPAPRPLLLACRLFAP